MIKRPLLGMFLTMIAGILLGKTSVRIILLEQWKPFAGVLFIIGIAVLCGLVLLGAVEVASEMTADLRKRSLRHLYLAGDPRDPGRTFVRRLLILGAFLGLLRGSLQEWHYQNTVQALERARLKEQQVYAAGLITQIKQTETSIYYQLSHCTLQTEGASGSVPDLTIYQVTKTKYQNKSDGGQDIASVAAKDEMKSGNVQSNSSVYVVGDYIMLYAIPAELSEATNDGGYDEKRSYYEKGIAGKFLSPKMKYTKAPWYLTGWGKVLSALDHMVQNYQTAFQSVLSPDDLGILEAMCLGRKEHLSRDMKDLFQNAGISHILAISGVHISILGMFMFRRIRKFRISVGSACVLAVLLSLLFAISTGSGTSALRAVVMFGVFLGSIFWGKSYDGLSSLSFAGMLLLLAEPNCIVGASFQYSFAAVAGIFGVQELIRSKYERLHPVFSSLLVSLAAWLTTLPLTAWYQYRITTYSMLLNLFVLPLASPILVGGLFGGGIKVLAGVLAGIQAGTLNILLRALVGIGSFTGERLLKLAELCIQLLRDLAEGYGKLPGGSLLVGKPHWGICVCFYFALFVIYKIAKNRKIFLYFVGIVPFILIVVSGNRIYGNKVVFLDVGQGDGIYLESADGRSYFIDGGSSSESQVGRYTLQPFLEYHARGNIDVWFISHCDTDHISGLLELMESGYPIGRIVFASDIVPEENYNSILELAKQLKIPVSYMGEGDYYQTEQICFTSLRGEADSSENIEGVGNRVGLDRSLSEDPNDHCLVLLTEFVSGGQTFLFAGDSSIETEEDFLPFLQKQLAGRLLFLMKADHHGSKNSNGEALLQVAQPKVAVISCGSTNLYGHPHRETLERFAETEVEVWRTDHVGAIEVVMYEDREMIEGYKNKK